MKATRACCILCSPPSLYATYFKQLFSLNYTHIKLFLAFRGVSFNALPCRALCWYIRVKITFSLVSPSNKMLENELVNLNAFIKRPRALVRQKD